MEQPYRYDRRPLVEPDHRRLPGFRDVTDAEWRDVQWQRSHCVKNVRQLRAVWGDLVGDEFYADLERDQAERATMSLLVPPQMLNTMVPTETPEHRLGVRRPGPPLHAAGALRPRPRLAVAPAGHPRLAARAGDVGGRGPDPPLPHQGAGRDPADLPAILRALHPDGPGRQLDAAGREAEVRGEAGRPAGRDDRLPAPHAGRARRRGLRRRRGQHAVPAAGVVRLPADGGRLHPRHPAGDQGADGDAAALAAAARCGRAWPGWPSPPARRGISLAIHTHVNAAQQVTPLVAEAAGAMLEAGVRDVRNQGVLLRGTNDSAEALLDLCFALLDEAQIMPYYFYLCDMIPNSRALAAGGLAGAAAAARDHGLPARFRHAATGLRRPVRGQALGPPDRRVRPRAAASRTGRRTTRPRTTPPILAPCSGGTRTTTRSGPCRPPARSGGGPRSREPELAATPA